MVFKNIIQASLNRRALLIASLLLTSGLSSGCVTQSSTKPPKILFVCQAGTAKSAIAREIFRQRAQERRIAVEVISRGIVIEDHVSPKLKQQLRADGINTTTEPAMPLQLTDWTTSDILVNFNPLPSAVVHEDARDWSDLPSVNDDYFNARAILDERIDALLTEIANKKK